MTTKRAIVWVSDLERFVPSHKAALPLTDIGLQRGIGVFEAIMAYGQKPAGLKAHLKRLRNSARLLGIEYIFSDSFLKEKILEGVKKVNSPYASIKILLTGGDARYLKIESKARLYISISSLELLPKELYVTGVRLLTTSLSRTLPEVKTFNYINGVIAYKNAQKKKYYDAVYTDTKGSLLEGTTFNVALIKDKTLITPEHLVLSGITMSIVMKLAKELGFSIIRKAITQKELKVADEAFLTSSFREVMPVVKIDDIKIGSGRPGPVAAKLLELYRTDCSKD